MNTPHFHSAYVSDFLYQFKKTKLWANMTAMVENSKWHREANVAVHTEMCLLALVDDNSWEFKMASIAIAFHDVGKPYAAFPQEDGSVKSPSHEVTSANMFIDFIFHNALSLTQDEIIGLHTIIEFHVPFIMSDKQIGRLYNELEKYNMLEVFKRVVMADQTGRISDISVEDRIQAVNDFFNGPRWVPGKKKMVFNIGNIVQLYVGYVDPQFIMDKQSELQVQGTVCKDFYSNSQDAINKFTKTLDYCVPDIDVVLRVYAPCNTYSERRRWCGMPRQRGYDVVAQRVFTPYFEIDEHYFKRANPLIIDEAVSYTTYSFFFITKNEVSDTVDECMFYKPRAPKYTVIPYDSYQKFASIFN